MTEDKLMPCPDGWQIVPTELTQEMLDSTCATAEDDENMRGTWAELLRAAPTRPAREEVSGEWRDIASAPKDGAEILAYSEHGCTGTMLVRYVSPDDFLTEAEIKAYSLDGVDTETPDWFFSDFCAGGRLTSDCAPTHWMPLPPPSAAMNPKPAEQKADTGSAQEGSRSMTNQRNATEAVAIAQDKRRIALIERISAIADLADTKPLEGELGDVAYDLLRQAAAQLSSDRLALGRAIDHIERAQKIIPEHQVNWHAAARQALRGVDDEVGNST